MMDHELTKFIARATGREAVTYRDTWPHEYVLAEWDGQQGILQVVCQQFRSGGSVLPIPQHGTTPTCSSATTSTG